MYKILKVLIIILRITINVYLIYIIFYLEDFFQEENLLHYKRFKKVRFNKSYNIIYHKLKVNFNIYYNTIYMKKIFLLIFICKWYSRLKSNFFFLKLKLTNCNIIKLSVHSFVKHKHNNQIQDFHKKNWVFKILFRIFCK